MREYFDSGGQSLLHELEAERERRSAELDFEAAAAQHAKVAKIKAILSACDDICGRLDRLDAVIIQPSAEAKAVSLFRFHGGELLGPAPVPMESEGMDQKGLGSKNRGLRRSRIRQKRTQKTAKQWSQATPIQLPATRHRKHRPEPLSAQALDGRHPRRPGIVRDQRQLVGSAFQS